MYLWVVCMCVYMFSGCVHTCGVYTCECAGMHLYACMYICMHVCSGYVYTLGVHV